MATEEREDDRRRRGLLLLLLAAVLLLLLLGLLLGYFAFGRDVAGGTGRPQAAGTPRPAAVQPSAAAGIRPSQAPVIVDGTGQAVAQPDGTTGSTSATGNGTALTSPGPLVTSSRVIGTVGPSNPATLLLVLSNPGQSAVRVTALSAQVTAVAGSPTPGAPDCSKDWYHVAPFSGSRTIAPGGQATIELAITFDDLPAVNQDSCKGARYTYTYRAVASP